MFFLLKSVATSNYQQQQRFADFFLCNPVVVESCGEKVERTEKNCMPLITTRGSKVLVQRNCWFMQAHLFQFCLTLQYLTAAKYDKQDNPQSGAWCVWELDEDRFFRKYVYALHLLYLFVLLCFIYFIARKINNIVYIYIYIYISCMLMNELN